MMGIERSTAEGTVGSKVRTQGQTWRKQEMTTQKNRGAMKEEGRRVDDRAKKREEQEGGTEGERENDGEKDIWGREEEEG